VNRIATKLICAVLLCISGLAHSEEFTAKIIAVLDGDTVLVRRENGLVKIRLAEIDASEKAQSFGETSKRSLSDMVLGKQVKVVSQAVDQYGRLVAHLYVAAPSSTEGRASDETTSQSTRLANNANQVAGYGGVPLAGDGWDVNAEQIRRGMAWEYSNFHSNQALIALQNEAKQAPRGLWAQSNPTPPWEWRKQHPSTFSTQPNAAVSSVTAHANTTSPDPGCGNKKHCSEMSSCEEAQHYFAQCGVKTLDGNGNGVPCERLCAPIQKN
jgi:endonuclease YncB( thermonuclease family)